MKRLDDYTSDMNISIAHCMQMHSILSGNITRPYTNAEASFYHFLLNQKGL